MKGGNIIGLVVSGGAGVTGTSWAVLDSSHDEGSLLSAVTDGEGTGVSSNTFCSCEGSSGSL